MIVIIAPGTKWYLPRPWYDIAYWGLRIILILLVMWLLIMIVWMVIDR